MNFFNLIKNTFKKPTVNIILNDEKLNVFALRTKHECPLSPLLFNIIQEILDNVIRQENKVKDTQIGKEEIKLSLLPDDTDVYVENPKESTKKTPATSKFQDTSYTKVNCFLIYQQRTTTVI